MVNVALEVAGFLLVVAALALVSVPLALGVAGVGLIVIANRPPKQGRVDARNPPVP